MRLSIKLMLGFCTISLLVALMGYISLSISEEALSNHLGMSSVTLTDNLMDKLERDIYSRMELFQVVSKISAIKDPIIESNRIFDEMGDVQGYIDQKDKEWTSLPDRETNDFIRGLLDSQVSEDLKEIVKFFDEKYGYRVYGEIFITNRYGAIVSLSGKTTDYRQDDEEWWQLAKAERIYFGDIDYDRSAGIYSNDIAIRIDDENGTFLGILKVVLNIDELISIIDEAKTNAEFGSTEFKLIDRNNKLIYSTDIRESHGKAMEAMPEIGNNHGQKYFLTDDVLIAYADSRGYRDFKGLGWTLLVVDEVDEIFKPIQNLRNIILLFSLILIMLAILGGFAFSYTLSKPIIDLRDKAREIGKGNLNVEIVKKTEDEIGELADTFNKMKESLKGSRNKLQKHSNSLEKSVKEKTKELEKRIKELEKFHKMTVGRELKMIELKKKIKELQKK